MAEIDSAPVPIEEAVGRLTASLNKPAPIIIGLHDATWARQDDLRLVLSTLAAQFKAVTVAQSNAALNAKLLLRFRDLIGFIVAGFADEGDRVYLGSTNHADELREVSHDIENLHWDKILASSQPETDLYAIIEALRSDNEAQSVLLRDIRAGLEPFAIAAGVWDEMGETDHSIRVRDPRAAAALLARINALHPEKETRGS